MLRKVVWDAEGFANPDISGDGLALEDAEGEDDPDYAAACEFYMNEKPKGVRLDDGTVAGMDVFEPEKESQVEYPGLTESEPTDIRDIVSYPFPFLSSCSLCTYPDRETFGLKTLLPRLLRIRPYCLEHVGMNRTTAMEVLSGMKRSILSFYRILSASRVPQLSKMIPRC